MHESPSIAVVLLNLGGPDSCKAVQPFLYNLFADPDIIPVPFSRILQKPFAYIVSQLRAKITQQCYDTMGGHSPIRRLTEEQAHTLEVELRRRGLNVDVIVGMRYWRPFNEDAAKLLAQGHYDHVVLLPLFPQYSLGTTGSSAKDLNDYIASYVPHLVQQQTLVRSYEDHPSYIRSVKTMIDLGLEQNPWSCPKDEVLLLFSAHSLPVAYVEKTKDVYPQHIEATMHTVAKTYFPNNPYKLCFQSKLGPVPWLEPYTDNMLEDLAAEGQDNILIYPISFVSDHIETLYEIDGLYIPLATKLGMKNCYRTPSLNSHPSFITALADLVTENLPQQYALQQEMATV